MDNRELGDNILHSRDPFARALNLFVFTMYKEEEKISKLNDLKKSFEVGDYVKYLEIYQLGNNGIDVALQELKDAMDLNFIYILEYSVMEELEGQGVISTYNKFTTLNYKTLDQIRERYETEQLVGTIRFSSDDQKFLTTFELLKALYKIPKKGTIVRKGRVFPYLNTSRFNLMDYQIISRPEDIKICREHCLLYALRKAGMTKASLLSVREHITSANFPASKLKMMADILNITIILRNYRKDNKNHEIKDGRISLSTRKTVYGSGTRKIEIALYKEHYFRYDIIEYNYINARCNPVAKRESSLQLIRRLYEEGKFITDKCFDTLPKLFNKSDNSDLNVDHQSITNNAYMIKTNKPKVSIVYADTESTTNNKMSRYRIKKGKKVKEQINTVHIAFRHGFIFEEDTEVVLSKSYKEHFDKIVDRAREQDAQKAIVYYHNLKYDFALMKLDPDLMIKNMTVKDGQYYSVKLIHNKFELELRDSYKLVSYKLDSFQSNFALDACKQEMILYHLYNKDNINAVTVPLEIYTGQPAERFYDLKVGAKREYVKITKEDTKDKDYVIIDNKIVVSANCVEEFNKIIPGVKLATAPRKGYKGLSIKGSYSHNTHCDFYLKYDCIVLQQGLRAFNAFMEDKLKVSIHDSLTISSLAHRYALSKGCYEGVYGINNTTQNFVTQCMAGGRVATRCNQRHIANGRIEDYDGVSLYPSAIRRFCTEIGFPKGQFKIIKSLTHFKKIRKTAVYYFVELIAEQDTIRQQIAFPRVKVKTDNFEKIVYTNEIRNKHLFLGKIALEDLEEFCELRDYSFVKGIYWTKSSEEIEPTNKKLGDVVQELFDLRLEMKKNGNKVGDTCMKLSLNSLYGKNMQGRCKEKIVCKKRYEDAPKFKDGVKVEQKEPREFMRYLIKNSSDIKSFSFIGKTAIFKEEFDSIEEPNNIHIACMILDMSRRIMNEVISIADENKVIILYTDTDSMHIINNNDKLKLLEDKYFEKYGRVLAGNDLGQFHKDFVFPNHIDVYAIKSIIVDKKVYCDTLRGIRLETVLDKYGAKVPKKVDGKIVIEKDEHGNPIVDTTTHYRFKGINKAAMMEQAKKYGSVENVYLELIKNNSITFDLCAGDNPSFDLRDIPYFRESFTRKVEFKPIVVRRYGKKLG